MPLRLHNPSSTERRPGEMWVMWGPELVENTRDPRCFPDGFQVQSGAQPYASLDPPKWWVWTLHFLQGFGLEPSLHLRGSLILRQGCWMEHLEWFQSRWHRPQDVHMVVQINHWHWGLCNLLWNQCAGHHGLEDPHNQGCPSGFLRTSLGGDGLLRIADLTQRCFLLM